ncbi:MAG: DUF4492 domain-containing protein [Prevotella sp.]|jgi:hypothetical protein|nr:DUF4492 domain-containing protein [Prevotella sp.]
MQKDSFLHRAFDLYYDGFRSMRLGKTLWAIILIKLFIIFAILKVFFFPNFLKEHAGGDEAGYVAGSLIERSSP